MIDPHVHCRDWRECGSETLVHAFTVAHKAGIDAIFEMPNTDPPLISRDAAVQRIKDGDTALETAGVPFFHGIYGGITREEDQLKEILDTYHEFRPRLVGLKMFTGPSTGSLKVSDPGEMEKVYRFLADARYEGVLALHCEDENIIRQNNGNRPLEAELSSVRINMELAQKTGFLGTIHICHVTSIKILDLIKKARASGLSVRCGCTPHHLLLNTEYIQEGNRAFLTMNPPLRSKNTQAGLFNAFLEGEIDWLESDHAPHSIEAKRIQRRAGIPGLHIIPYVISFFKAAGMDRELLKQCSHGNIEKAFGFSIPDRDKAGSINLFHEYPADPYLNLLPELKRKYYFTEK